MSYILLIEPDKKLAATYEAMLRRAGHTVRWSAHAQDAIGLADAHKPDVVVLELQLASHNGVEFLYEFRSYPDWQRVPVVLLTLVQPYALNITAEMMERLGIVRCLYKPATTLQQLRRAVDECSLVV